MDLASTPPRRRELAAARARLDSAHAAGRLSDAAHAAATQSVNGVQSQAELNGLLDYFVRDGTQPGLLPSSAPPSVRSPHPGVADVARPGRSLRPGRLLAIGALAVCLVAAGPRDTLDSIRGGIESIVGQVRPTSAEPLSAAGFEVWRDRLVTETGSSKVFYATLEDTSAVATVAVPGDSGTSQTYLFDGDWKSLNIESPTDTSSQIDLADFDPLILDELIDSARTRLEIADPSTVRVTFGTQVTTTSTGQDTRTTSQDVVVVSLTSESRSGTVTTGLDGQDLDDASSP